MADRLFWARQAPPGRRTLVERAARMRWMGRPGLPAPAGQLVREALRFPASRPLRPNWCAAAEGAALTRLAAAAAVPAESRPQATWRAVWLDCRWPTLPGWGREGLAQLQAPTPKCSNGPMGSC